MLPVAAWSARELPMDTPTPTPVATTTLEFVAMTAQTADGAGPQMMQPSGPQLKVCADASPMIRRSALAATAIAFTMVVAEPTALLATGLGPPPTRLSGTRQMLTAAALLARSKRPSLAETAALSTTAFVAATAESAAGPGMQMTLTSGKARVQTAAAKTGGVASD